MSEATDAPNVLKAWEEYTKSLAYENSVMWAGHSNRGALWLSFHAGYSACEKIYKREDQSES